ncbi:MAG: sensor histidine kinase [Prevotella sp.]
MKWLNRIGQGRFILAVAAIVIAVASLVVSHRLTNDLEAEEHNKMEVWAEAMRTLNVADDDTDLTLVLKVIDENHTIPVIVLNPQGSVQTYRNLDVPHDAYPDSMHYVASIGQRLLREGRYIRIQLSDSISTDYIVVCYDDSTTLKRLAAYPMVQLGVVLIFVIVAILALLISKRAEQNKVWVGLTKETAHQLGTPISSLMAWAEILHETYPNDPLIPEMEKDVQRLQLVADRFSKIGSLPELVPTSLGIVIGHVMAYMDRRTSHNVQIVSEGEAQSLIVRLNASLFEWVIENLCKNAVDAMGGEAGTITLRVGEAGQRAFVEVEDTGKGIRKKDMAEVFSPGFTTKKRGWGLGLSLAKRIVEEYHHGRIFVKWSEVGRGTIFRIELKK